MDQYTSESTRLGLVARETSALTIPANEKEKFTSNIIELSRNLMNEMRDQGLSRSATARRLQREKSHWFPSASCSFFLKGSALALTFLLFESRRP